MKQVASALCVVVLVCACQSQPTTLERARQQVPVGTIRENAIAILSQEAWYHEPCSVDDVYSTDLFFFGSKKYDEAEIVIVDSRAVEGVLQVYQVSTFESYAWQGGYRDCIDRSKFED